MLDRLSIVRWIATAGVAGLWLGACFYDWSDEGRGGGGATATSSGGAAGTTSSTGGAAGTTATAGTGGAAGSGCGGPGELRCEGLCCKAANYEACELDYSTPAPPPPPTAQCLNVDASCSCDACDLPDGNTWTLCCGDAQSGYTYFLGTIDFGCPPP